MAMAHPHVVSSRRSAERRSGVPCAGTRTLVGILLVAVVVVLYGAGSGGDSRKEALTEGALAAERILAARAAVEKQCRDGLLSRTSYRKRVRMLEERLAGTYVPESLSAGDPPLNFIQNGGFEQTNPNSAKNRSRWLWWGGWSWGGDYENLWEDRPEFVHSGKYSRPGSGARARRAGSGSARRRFRPSPARRSTG